MIEPTCPRLDFGDYSEVWRLLEFATPAQRRAWLDWCCEQVRTPTTRTAVVAFDGSALVAYADFLSICGKGSLTLAGAVVKLTDLVRGR